MNKQVVTNLANKRRLKPRPIYGGQNAKNHIGVSQRDQGSRAEWITGVCESRRIR
jgi:hypothetical protein